MRKLLVSESLTLDGVFEGPAKTPFEPFAQAGWTAPYFDEDIMKYVSGNIAQEGTLLFGRVTYEQFQASWMVQTGPVADYMNRVKKYVVSTTLNKAEWSNSTLIAGNAVEEIAKLKGQDGPDLAILGSGALARSLMAADLIDEYALLVYPVVLGTGKRFFNEGNKAALKLKESKTFGSGVVFLAYVPERDS